jgi:hypothetical protein
MTGDQRKFVSLKKKGGNVAFGDDSSTKILGKGTVNLGSENVKARKVILVEDLNHNTSTYCKNFDVLFAALWTKVSILSQNRGNL